MIDSLASIGVFMMGEGNEQTPFAILQNIPRIIFLNRAPSEDEKKAYLFHQMKIYMAIY